MTARSAFVQIIDGAGERFTGIDVRLNPSPLISPNPNVRQRRNPRLQAKSALVFLPPFIAPVLQASISEGLGHCLVHLMDRKFVGDEPLQRIGGLECVQEAQAAWVAGRGWLFHRGGLFFQ